MRRANGSVTQVGIKRDKMIVGTRDSRPLRDYNTAVYNSSTNFMSAITTEKSYTSFKWILNDYTLLENYYLGILESPKFPLTNTDKQCQLIFLNDAELIHLSLKVPQDITCEVLEICFSIINGPDKKVVQSRLLAYPRKEKESPYLLYEVMLVNSNEILFNGKHLVNDTLTLLCEIIIVHKVNAPKINVHSSNVVHSDKSTCQQFQQYYFDKAFCDVDLFVSEKQFRAHKLILAAASPVFKAMFKADMLETKQNSVRITDIDADVFDKFLQYLYVGKVENLDQVAVDLLSVAGKYQVSALIDLCENFAIDTIDLSNAVERLFVAHQHSFKKLKDVALQFVRSNIHNITKENGFKELCVASDLFAEVFNKPQ